MWYLEHLSLRGVCDQLIPRKHTLVDIFHNGRVAQDTTSDIQHFFDSSDLIQHVTLPKQLKVSTLGGTNGLSIDELSQHQDKQLILEISVYWLYHIPEQALKYITNHFHLMLTDLEDGGQLAHNKLTVFFVTSKIVPKNTIFYLTSSTNLNSIDMLNIKHIHFPYWLFHVGANACIDKSSNKNLYMQRITESNQTNNILFLNFKPRLYRLKLLTRLYSQGLLDHMEWSLVNRHFSTEPSSAPDRDRPIILVEREDITQQTLSRLSQEEYDVYNTICEQYTIPRIYSPIHTTHDQHTLPDEDFAKYAWLLSVETGFGNEFKLNNKIGKISFLTEKTYKAFVQGCMPLTLCDDSVYSYLTSLGFKVDSHDIDMYNDSEEKLTHMVETCKNIIENNVVPDKDDIIHNFNLITDIKWLGKIFSESLINIMCDIQKNK